jgi:hypothetical protein
MSELLTALKAAAQVAKLQGVHQLGHCGAAAVDGLVATGQTQLPGIVGLTIAPRDGDGK